MLMPYCCMERHEEHIITGGCIHSLRACADCASIQAQNEFDLPFSDEDETGPHNKSQRLRGASQQSLTGGASSPVSISTHLRVTRLLVPRQRHMQSMTIAIRCKCADGVLQMHQG